MSLKTGVSVLAVTVGVANPVWAEMDAREVWADVNILLSAMGGVTVDQITESETEVSLAGVTITSGDAVTRLPQVLLTETADGGVRAVFAPGGTYEMGNRRRDEVLTADLVTDGLDVTFNDTDGLAFAMVADRLGIENIGFTLDGVAQEMSGEFVATAIDVSFSDTGPDAETRVMAYDASIGPVTAVFDAQDIDEVGLIDFDMSISGLQSSAQFDAPSALYEGRTNLIGVALSRATLDLGAVTLTTVVRAEEETEEDRARYDMTVNFDGLTLDHSAHIPLDQTQYMNGQDLFPDDLEGYLEYTVGNLIVDVQSEFSYGYGEEWGSRNVVDLQIADTNLTTRYAVDANSVVTVNATVAANMDLDVQDAYSSEYSRNDTNVAFGLSNLAYVIDVSVPLDNAMMQIMQGLPAGLRYGVDYSLDAASFAFNERSNYGDEEDYIEMFEGELQSLSASSLFTDTQLEMLIEAALMRGTYEGYDAPEGVGGEVTGMRVEALMPLSTGSAVAPYLLDMAVASVTLDENIWSIIDPDGVMDRSPMAMNLNVSGDTIANFNPVGFIAMGAGGFSPILPQNTAFEFLITAVGARIAGTGAFDTSRTIQDETPPVGTASFEGTGVAELMETMARMGMLTEAELSEGQFLFGAFTTEDADGTRRMDVEINDQQHLIVNGQRMQ